MGKSTTKLKRQKALDFGTGFYNTRPVFGRFTLKLEYFQDSILFKF
jgi:hypothetical protein